jgi:hypothetical protein
MSPKIARAAVGSTLMILVAAFIGCSRQSPVAPNLQHAYSAGAPAAASRSPEGAFFPLTIGNRWHSVADDQITIEPVGGGPPTDEFTIHADITRNLVGTETLFGRPYVVEEETAVLTGVPGSPGPVTDLSWIRFRQDGTGLYEADVDASVPPAPAGSAARSLGAQSAATPSDAQRPLPPALASRISDVQRGAYEAAWSRLQARVAIVRSVLRGSLAPRLDAAHPEALLENELTRLGYPLHPGASWLIRPTPLFSSSVEAVESVNLPAGRFQSYRIRIDSEVFGPDDAVRVWFGRSGQLALRFHVVSTVVDENGNEIGRMVDDRDETLHDMTLLKP